MYCGGFQVSDINECQQVWTTLEDFQVQEEFINTRERFIFLSMLLATVQLDEKF